MSGPGNYVLLIEDDEDDVYFMKRAMWKAGISIPLRILDNGHDAIEYLGGKGDRCDHLSFTPPVCIFLDLKLPFVAGLEVLEWIRTQQSLSKVPVFVITSSAQPKDQERAERLGAKAY